MNSITALGEEFSKQIAGDGRMSLKKCIQTLQAENNKLHAKCREINFVSNVYKARLKENNLSTATEAADHEINICDTQKIVAQLSRENAQLKRKITQASRNKTNLDKVNILIDSIFSVNILVSGFRNSWVSFFLLIKKDLKPEQFFAFCFYITFYTYSTRTT